MESLTTKKITGDMTIGSILEGHPDKAMKLSEIMAAAGLHCVGCGAATFETLEQGVVGHGFEKSVLDKLIVDLNNVLEEEEIIVEEGEPIILTDSAVKKVKELSSKEGKNGYGLRVAVLAGGCAGHSYSLNLQENPEKSDLVFEINGVKVFVDKDSIHILQGTQINYVDTLEESGFKFENPNSKSSCGCGKSFN